jgi:hypothetical protein
LAVNSRENEILEDNRLLNHSTAHVAPARIKASAVDLISEQNFTFKLFKAKAQLAESFKFALRKQPMNLIFIAHLDKLIIDHNNLHSSLQRHSATRAGGETIHN